MSPEVCNRIFTIEILSFLLYFCSDLCCVLSDGGSIFSEHNTSDIGTTWMIIPFSLGYTFYLSRLLPMPSDLKIML